MFWNGKAWGGSDVPDIRPDAAPDENVGPFIMTAEGVAKLFARAEWPMVRCRSITSRSSRRSP